MDKLWSDAPGSSGPDAATFQQAAGVRQAVIWDPGLDAASGQAGTSASRTRTSAAPGASRLDFSAGGRRAQSLDPVVDYGFSTPSGRSPLDLTSAGPAWAAPVSPGPLGGQTGSSTLGEGSATGGRLGFQAEPRRMRDLISGDRSSDSERDAALLEMDRTRQALNPYLPERREDFQSAESLLRGAGFVRLPGESDLRDGAASPSLMRELTTKLQGPPSLAPAMALPVPDRGRSDWLSDPNLIKLTPRR